MPHYQTAARTDIGLVRSNNEDALLALYLPDGQHLWLVADGVAGRDAGELASATSVGVFQRLAQSGKLAAARDPDLATPLLAMAVHKAHVEVSRLAVESQQKLSMSCTLTAALATDQRIDIVHVGDSRLYHLHAGALTQITEDQTVTRQLIADGRLSEDQLAEHPDRNTLSQSIGLESAEHPFTPAHYRIEVTAGDRLLLCSDGLSDLLAADTIAMLLRDASDPATAVEHLIQSALDAGGRDNISVIVVAASSRAD
jgi:protein phosphatase